MFQARLENVQGEIFLMIASEKLTQLTHVSSSNQIFRPL